MKNPLLAGLAVLVLGTAQPARAQLLPAVINGVLLIRQANKTSNANPTAPVVTLATYRTRSFVQQRTPPAGRGILGGDQITYLERQLDQCRARLQADSTGQVCTAAQLQQLQATQAAVVAAQRKWPMQPYADEIAFYTAEDARRQQAAGSPASLK